MQEINKFVGIGDKINLLLLNGYDDHQYISSAQKNDLSLQTGYDSSQYVSRVESINDDKSIDVLIPISKNRLVYIKNDTFLIVIFIKDGAIFEFKAQVINKVFGSIPLLRLIKVSEVNKIQRRNYYRLKIVKNIKVRRIINLKEKQYDEYFNASLNDLSGGGVALSSTQELDRNDIIEVNLDLDSNSIRIFGKIVRKNVNEDGSANKFMYGVNFEKITEVERNIIMRFIFEEQRKLAKKGLI